MRRVLNVSRRRFEPEAARLSSESVQSRARVLLRFQPTRSRSRLAEYQQQLFVVAYRLVDGIANSRAGAHVLCRTPTTDAMILQECVDEPREGFVPPGMADEAGMEPNTRMVEGDNFVR